MFLAFAWEHHDLRVGAIAVYIRERIEIAYMAGQGWENYLKARFTARRRRLLGTRPSLSALGTRGVFFTTQLLAIVIVIARYFFIEHHALALPSLDLSTLNPGQFTVLLIAADLLALVVTLPVLRHVRK
jgi:hypothetical protein